MTGYPQPHSGNAGLPGVSYYDLVLFVVPMPLLVGLLLGELLALPSQAGLAAGAALSALLVSHVLFLDPPTRRGPGGPTGPRESSEPRGPANGPSA